MKVSKFIKEYIWIIFTGFIACLIIVILRFTDFMPASYVPKEDSINYTFETISFSVLAAVIFWFINDFTAYNKRRKIAINHINRQIRTINELIRQMLNAIDPFSLESKRYSFESFMTKFNKLDLYDGFYGGSRAIVDVYSEYKRRIELIADSLLGSYSEYLSYDQLKYLDEILKSYLIRNTITPMDFAIPEEERRFYPSNQNEVGKSLYLLSKMKWPE